MRSVYGVTDIPSSNDNLKTARALMDESRKLLREINANDSEFQRMMDEKDARVLEHRRQADANLAVIQSEFKTAKERLDRSFAEFDRIMAQ